MTSRPRLTRARALAASLAALVALAAAACGGNASNGCPGGMTKVCLPDGSTCACSPSCTRATDCAAYSVCIGSSACTTCQSEGCACEADICVPHTWKSGQGVTFKRN